MSISIISESGDLRLQAVNNTATRLLNIGTGWTRARVGLRMHVVDTGSDIANFFFIATIQADQNSRYRTGSPALTLKGGNGGFPNNTRNAGPPVTYGFTQCSCSQKHGATELAGSSQAWQLSADSSVMNAFFFEVRKGSPNYGMDVFHPNTLAAGQTDVSFDLFYDYLLNGNMADGTGITGWPAGYSAPATFNTPVDEATYGDLIYAGIEYEPAVGGAVISDFYVAGE